MDGYPFQRRLGAFPVRPGKAEVRVWAPRATDVRVGDIRMEPAGYGIYEATIDAEPGDDYEITLDGTAYPDPCSRWQPAGLRGPSRLLDTDTFEWTDQDFRAPQLHDAVIYELHGRAHVLVTVSAGGRAAHRQRAVSVRPGGRSARTAAR
jgi:maltooligosyltrehalose trehalohydrolase